MNCYKNHGSSNNLRDGNEDLECHGPLHVSSLFLSVSSHLFLLQMNFFSGGIGAQLEKNKTMKIAKSLLASV